MFKKIICIISTLIILIPLFAIPASATDTDVNLWTYKDWKNFFGETFDFTKYTDTVIAKLEELSKNEKQFVWIKNYSEMFSYECDDDGIDIFSPDVSTPGFSFRTSSSKVYPYTYFYPTTTSYYSSTTAHMPFVPYSADEIYILSDYNEYIEAVNSGLFSDCSNIYYCKNPFQSLIDFIESLAYDNMFYDVYPLKDGHQNIIRFYDCFDSYYGEYQYDFYEDNMLNYLNSSFSINSPIYYQPKGLDTNHQLEGADLQHNEMYYIYIPVPDDFSISQTNEHLTSLGSAIHYEKGPIDFGTWYDTYIKPWLSKVSANSDYKLITLKNVEPSTTDNPTVNTTDKKQDINLLRLTFPSFYTFLESSEDDKGFIMTGCRTMSTGQKVNLSDGSIDDTAKDGIGSNIDGGDYLDDKDTDDLLANGFKNGYPNKSNYSYKITVNKNGYILYEIYFDRKPVVKSNFYSDSQIVYDVDFNLTRGYFYAKQQNCYIDFNFRNQNEEDYLYSNGNFIDNVTDDIKKSMANKFAQIVDCFVNGVGYFTQKDYEYVNYEKYLTEKIIRVWTNYTGQLTGVYRGYYVQFNWDLESDKDFIKNNSDDDHNYSDDFLDDGDGFKDNNGNIHGGGTSTDTSLDTSVDEDFNFDEEFEFNTESLTNMISNFLKLLTKMFSVFPEWVWAVLFIGFSIIVACRLLGR